MRRIVCQQHPVYHKTCLNTNAKKSHRKITLNSFTNTRSLSLLLSLSLAHTHTHTHKHTHQACSYIHNVNIAAWMIMKLNHLHVCIFCQLNPMPFNENWLMSWEKHLSSVTLTQLALQPLISNQSCYPLKVKAVSKYPAQPLGEMNIEI